MMTAAELSEMAKGVLVLINETSFDWPLMNQLKNQIGKDIEILDEAIRSKADEDSSEVLANLDKIRDRNYLNVRGVIEASFYEDIVVKIEGAKYLAELIKNYDWQMHSLGYAQETEQLHKLFAAFEVPDAQEAITALELDEKIQKLKDSQKVFEKTYDKYEGDVPKSKIITLKNSKMRLKRHLDTLFGNIDFINESKDTAEQYESLSASINNIISGVRDTVSKRKPLLLEEEMD